MTNWKIGAIAAFAFMTMPAAAFAGGFAVATANVNVRAGPTTGYPIVDVAYAGDEVYVHGCLETRAWCDVDYDGLRGWISSNYLAFYQAGYRYVGPQATYRMRAPVITFSFGTYWDRHYRGRPFYRDRSRWERYHRGHYSPPPVVRTPPQRRVEQPPRVRRDEQRWSRGWREDSRQHEGRSRGGREDWRRHESRSRGGRDEHSRDIERRVRDMQRQGSFPGGLQPWEMP